MSTVIHGLVDERRRALSTDALKAEAGLHHVDGTWGLALSGGGIRSATFCFGLLQALAAKRLFLRFDLLSTVSGGGYIGSMVGRLIQRATTPDELMEIVEALRRGGNSWFAWWLRANGRYLVPQGVRDRFFALAVYVRNLIGIHLELGLLGLLMGASLSIVDAAGWWGFGRAVGLSWGIVEWARNWIDLVPTIWLLLVPLAFWALVLCWAFWMVSWIEEQFVAVVVVAVVACAIAIPLAFARFKLPDSQLVFALTPSAAAIGVITLIAVAWACGVAVAWSAWSAAALATNAASAGPREGRALQDETYDTARNRLTKSLATSFRTMGWIVLAGLVDRAAWWLAYEQPSWTRLGYALVVIAAALRVLLSPTSSVRNAATSSTLLPRLLSVLGRVLTFVLLVWWVAVVHKVALSGIFEGPAPDFTAPAPWIACIALIVVPYLLLTGMNVRFLNLSSLHGFYRARLIRSYLGATNARRFEQRATGGGGSAAGGPVAGSSPARPEMRVVGPLPASPDEVRLLAVDDVEAADDIALHEYAPHRIGGPIHLLNVCLNETRNRRGGLFNQDRKGRVMTLGPAGLVRVGLGDWKPIRDEAGGLTLGSWMAISGAAVSPGLGSQTRGGISALAMFAGARLGYWWNSRAFDAGPGTLRWPFAKIRGLLDETLGDFKYREGRDWFLTDGGHFENTGAYALLAERARLIVVADCGIDLHYEFNDLENLVRKARIDLQAEIEFLKPVRPTGAWPWRPAELASLVPMFGSLNDLASNTSDACFALARVTYAKKADDVPTERPVADIGYLILVKPNMCSGLPVDLVNFKRDHPEFPQQSTADQFFDEAQWESYFSLGKALGERLSVEGLVGLVEGVDELFVHDDGSPIGKEGEAAAFAAMDKDVVVARLPARIAASTVSTSIGLGVVAASGAAAWQTIEGFRAGAAQQTRDERSAIKELVDSWTLAVQAPTPATRAATAGNTAAMLARFADTLCPDQDAGWFNRSPLAVDILKDTIDQCERVDESQRPRSCQRLISISQPYAEGRRASCLSVGLTVNEVEDRGSHCARYWAYDYRPHPLLACAHPADPVRRSVPSVVEASALVPSARLMHRQGAPVAPTETLRTYAPCRGRIIVPLAYGSSQKSLIEGYVAAWSRVGLDIDETRDLDRLARDEGRVPPVAASAMIVRYYDADSRECAELLGTTSGRSDVRVEPVYTTKDHRPGLVEVLIPPAAHETERSPRDATKTREDARGERDRRDKDAEKKTDRDPGADDGDDASSGNTGGLRGPAAAACRCDRISDDSWKDYLEAQLRRLSPCAGTPAGACVQLTIDASCKEPVAPRRPAASGHQKRDGRKIAACVPPLVRNPLLDTKPAEPVEPPAAR